MSARTKARKRAVDALYAGELRNSAALELLNTTRELTSDRQNQDEIFDYASYLVEGVVNNNEEIDQAISGLAQNWSLERMPALDRAILRIGAYEILFASDVPSEVAISEAVELAKELSTDDSPAFVNGVLAAIAATRKPI